MEHMHVGISMHMHIAAHAPEVAPRGESVSDAEPDEALKAFEALMTTNDIIIKAAFYFFCLPMLFMSALILVLYKLFWPQ